MMERPLPEPKNQGSAAALPSLSLSSTGAITKGLVRTWRSVPSVTGDLTPLRVASRSLARGRVAIADIGLAGPFFSADWRKDITAVEFGRNGSDLDGRGRLLSCTRRRRTVARAGANQLRLRSASCAAC